MLNGYATGYRIARRDKRPEAEVVRTEYPEVKPDPIASRWNHPPVQAHVSLEEALPGFAGAAASSCRAGLGPPAALDVPAHKYETPKVFEQPVELVPRHAHLPISIPIVRCLAGPRDSDRRTYVGRSASSASCSLRPGALGYNHQNPGSPKITT